MDAARLLIEFTRRLQSSVVPTTWHGELMFENA